jgi:hypothetical protein
MTTRSATAGLLPLPAAVFFSDAPEREKGPRLNCVAVLSSPGIADQTNVLNTGTCAWERNTSLVFIAGEDFNAERTFIRERVNPSEEVLLIFEGVTPATGGVRIGTWELRTPGQILIGRPLEISISVFEQGN